MGQSTASLVRSVLVFYACGFPLWVAGTQQHAAPRSILIASVTARRNIAAQAQYRAKQVRVARRVVITTQVCQQCGSSTQALKGSYRREVDHEARQVYILRTVLCRCVPDHASIIHAQHDCTHFMYLQFQSAKVTETYWCCATRRKCVCLSVHWCVCTCAGETDAELQSKIRALRARGVGSILDYAAEDDVPTTNDSQPQPQPSSSSNSSAASQQQPAAAAASSKPQDIGTSTATPAPTAGSSSSSSGDGGGDGVLRSATTGMPLLPAGMAVARQYPYST